VVGELAVVSRGTRGLALSHMTFQIDTSTEFGTRVEQRLRDEQLIWMVTVEANGTPEPSPVWFYWDGSLFVIYSRAGTPRERNIRRNPHVALHFDSTGHGGNIVVFSGRAEIADDLPPAHAMPEYAEKYRAGFTRIGVTAEQFSLAYPLALRVRPTRLRGF
jgi:PPOX class probable F420-dependent enzyme